MINTLNIKKIVSAGIFALLLFLPLSASCSEIKVRVVYTNWFPYTYEEEARPAGFEIEIFQAVLERMNVSAGYEMKPWQRCLTSLRMGNADALISMLKTPERERYADYPDEHISISKTVFFARTDSRIQFSGVYEELKDYRIGVIQGFSYGEVFDQAGFLQKDGAVDAKMLIHKLLGDRNDLIAENEAVIMATAHQMGFSDRIRSLEPAIHTQKLYVGFSKAKVLGEMSRKFSQTLADFKQTQEYVDILNKYGIYNAMKISDIR